MLKILAVFMMTLALLCGAAPAQTADLKGWPNRPITLVLPFPAGSGIDIVARIIGDRLGTKLHTPIIVDPHPGASGVLAATYVDRAAPDGYTLLLTTNTTHSANPSLIKNLPYDPIKDFTPIARVGYLPFVLVVNAKLPIKDVHDLVAYAKARPGQVNYASINAVSLVGMSVIGQSLGLQLTNVPYKGAPDALRDLLTGEVSLMLLDVTSAKPFIQSGELRALAVTTTDRSPTAPEIPGTREAGFPDVNLSAWNGLFGPAKMPKAIVARINAAINEVVSEPDTKARLAQIGFDAFSGSPEEFDAFVHSELVKWTGWIKAAGIQPE